MLQAEVENLEVQSKGNFKETDVHRRALEAVKGAAEKGKMDESRRSRQKTEGAKLRLHALVCAWVCILKLQ